MRICGTARRSSPAFLPIDAQTRTASRGRGLRQSSHRKVAAHVSARGSAEETGCWLPPTDQVARFHWYGCAPSFVRSGREPVERKEPPMRSSIRLVRSSKRLSFLLAVVAAGVLASGAVSAVVFQQTISDTGNVHL